jgi:hypothetical protein
MFKSYVILLYCGCLFPIVLKAQNAEPLKHSEISISGGLNSNSAWEVEPTFTYMLNRYLGGSIGLNYSDQFNNKSYRGNTINDSNLTWLIDNDEANVYNILLRPAIHLRSPEILLGSDKDYCLTFNIEPGAYLTIPNDRVSVKYIKKNSYTEVDSKDYLNKNGEWLYWNLRSSIEMTIDNISFSIGYSFSNFDVYGNRRNIIIENKHLGEMFPKRQYTHAGFISIGYLF